MERKNNTTGGTSKEYKQLSISISRDGLSFLVHNQNRVELHKTHQFFPFKSPEGLLRSIEGLIDGLADFDKLDRVLVVYSNQLYATVPEAFFDVEHLSDYLKFNIQMLSSDFAVFDELQHSEIKNVYIPYANINNFLFDKFGEFDYCHSTSVLIDYCITKKRAGVYLHIHSGSFDCCVIDGENQLQLINSFDYQTPEDFIYYVLFSYEQTNLDPEEMPVFLIGKISRESELFEISYKFIRHVEVLKADDELIFVDQENNGSQKEVDPIFLNACL